MSKSYDKNLMNHAVYTTVSGSRTVQQQRLCYIIIHLPVNLSTFAGEHTNKLAVSVAQKIYRISQGSTSQQQQKKMLRYLHTAGPVFSYTKMVKIAAIESTKFT